MCYISYRTKVPNLYSKTHSTSSHTITENPKLAITKNEIILNESSQTEQKIKQISTTNTKIVNKIQICLIKLVVPKSNLRDKIFVPRILLLCLNC